MSANSSIEWTDATWNPVRGCAIVSKGCTNCYAMRQAHRQSGPGGAYEGLTQLSKGGPVWTGKVRVVPELLDAPLRWRKPRRIFVNSMSDLFHEDVPDEFILRVFDAMRQSENGHAVKQHRLMEPHTFQILTKRPRRMLDFCTRLRFAQNDGRGLYLANELPHNGFNPMQALRHVWLGVSVEDQASADERIPLLLQTPAATRFVSYEPALGPVDFRAWLQARFNADDGPLTLDGLDWVIAGGESGPGARPSHPDSFRSLRDQCAAAGVPYFFKQWGAFAHAVSEAHKYERALVPDGAGGHFVMWRVGKRAAGRLLDGRTHDEYPA